MKKMKKIFITLLIVVIAMNFAFSQDDFAKIRIKANTGFSFLSSSINKINRVFTLDRFYTALAYPLGQISIDYKLHKMFSTGIAGSYQYFELDVHNSNNTVSYFNGVIQRINIGIRPLFFYVNNDFLEMYTGGRIGATIWLVEAESEWAEDWVEGNIMQQWILTRATRRGVVFAPQFIILGVNLYIVKGLGINAELATGSPYYFSGGLVYRF
jgi:hypothetical protein